MSLPSGVTQADIEGLPPTIYVNGHAYTFTLDDSAFPHFFLLAALSNPLHTVCPCALTQLMFYANPGTKVTYLGMPRTLKRVSVTSLRKQASESGFSAALQTRCTVTGNNRQTRAGGECHDGGRTEGSHYIGPVRRWNTARQLCTDSPKQEIYSGLRNSTGSPRLLR